MLIEPTFILAFSESSLFSSSEYVRRKIALLNNKKHGKTKK
jgi:hypothetical protein